MRFKLEDAYPREWRVRPCRSPRNGYSGVVNSLHDFIQRRSPSSTPESPVLTRYDDSFITNTPYGVLLTVNDIIEITGYPRRKVMTEVRLGNLDKVKHGVYVNRCLKSPPVTRLSRTNMVRWRQLVSNRNNVTPELMARAFGGTVQMWRDNIGW